MWNRYAIPRVGRSFKSADHDDSDWLRKRNFKQRRDEFLLARKQQERILATRRKVRFALRSTYLHRKGQRCLFLPLVFYVRWNTCCGKLYLPNLLYSRLQNNVAFKCGHSQFFQICVGNKDAKYGFQSRSFQWGSCHKRQRRTRQSVTAKREKSQTPKVLTAILTLPNLTQPNLTKPNFT